MIGAKELLEILEEFGIEKRVKLGKIEFILELNSISLLEGKFTKGEYFPDSRQIVLYTLLIKDKDDLKDVIIHEIGHHFGWIHK